jgi:hypothetical protein
MALLLLPGRAQPQTSLDPSKFDIVGLRFGMTVSEVQAALHAYDPAMDIRTGEAGSRIGAGSFTRGVRGYRQKSSDTLNAVKIRTGSDSYEEIIVLFTETEGNKAFAIFRGVKYPATRGPLADVLTRQAVAKYGPFDPRVDTPVQHSWAFLPDGKPATSPVFFTCINSTYGAEAVKFSDGHSGAFIGGGPDVGPNTVFDPRCGVAIRLTYHVESSSNPLVDFSALYLVDNSLLAKNIANIQHARQPSNAQHE